MSFPQPQHPGISESLTQKWLRQNVAMYNVYNDLNRVFVDVDSTLTGLTLYPTLPPKTGVNSPVTCPKRYLLVLSIPFAIRHIYSL